MTEKLGQDFDFKNVGFPTRFLGIDISVDMIISLSEEQFLLKVLKEFKMNDLSSLKSYSTR